MTNFGNQYLQKLKYYAKQTTSSNKSTTLFMSWLAATHFFGNYIHNRGWKLSGHSVTQTQQSHQNPPTLESTHSRIHPPHKAEAF